MFAYFLAHSRPLLRIGPLLAGMAYAASAACATQVTDIAAKPDNSAYQQDSRGTIVRSGTGLCWRSGYWTEEDAVAGCDGPLVPPVTKIIAPEIPSAPEPAVTAPPPPVTAAAPPARCDFSVTLTNEQAFSFNRAELHDAARRRLDEEVLQKLADCARIERITIIGHTDRLGSRLYNQKLSEKRAAAIAAYLTQKGVSAPFEVVGAGSSQAQQNCAANLNRKQLIACLAPDRRVVITVQGSGN